MFQQVCSGLGGPHPPGRGDWVSDRCDSDAGATKVCQQALQGRGVALDLGYGKSIVEVVEQHVPRGTAGRLDENDHAPVTRIGVRGRTLFPGDEQRRLLSIFRFLQKPRDDRR